MDNVKVIDISGMIKFDVPQSKAIAHGTWFDPVKIANADEHDIHLVVISDCYHAKSHKLWKFQSKVCVGSNNPDGTSSYSILKQRMLYLDKQLIKLTGKPADRNRLVIYNLPGVSLKQRAEFLADKIEQLNQSFAVTTWNPPAGYSRGPL